MVSLIDIVPQTRTVQTTHGEVELRGLGLRPIADLLVRFPELRKFLAFGAPALDIDILLAIAPDAVGTIIAEAAAQPAAADAIAAGFLLDDVIKCLLVIQDLTFPNGAVPLERGVRQLMGMKDPDQGTDQGTLTPPQPSNLSPPVMAFAT
jgi:hypothetical protein